MAQVEHRTRYNCASNPPRSIDAVFKALQKHFGRRLRPFANAKEVRGFVATVDREFQKKSYADDLVRFLENTRVLIADGQTGELWFDGERTSAISVCCERHAQPVATTTPAETRIRQLKERMMELRKPNHVDHAPAVAEEVTAPPQPENEEMVPTPPTRQKAERTFVLYLTPVEEDAWQSLVAAADPNSLSLIIPSDDAQLYGWKSAHIVCAPAEYRDVVNRFILSGIVKHEEGAPSAEHHRFAHDPDCYLIQPIAQRLPVRMIDSYREVAESLMNGEFVHQRGAKLFTELREFIMSRWPERANAIANMFSTFCAAPNHALGRRTFGYFIHDPENRVHWLANVRGFEAYLLQQMRETESPAVEKKPMVIRTVAVVNDLKSLTDYNLERAMENAMQAVEKAKQYLAEIREEKRRRLTEQLRTANAEATRLRQETEKAEQVQASLAAALAKITS